MWVQFLVYKGQSHGPNWALVIGLTSVFSPILRSGAFLIGPERMLPGQVPRRPRPEQPSKPGPVANLPSASLGSAQMGELGSTEGPEWAGGRDIGEWRSLTHPVVMGQGGVRTRGASHHHNQSRDRTELMSRNRTAISSWLPQPHRPLYASWETAWS